ncbi:MAG: maltose transporter permease protein [Devosia sp.]|uniref:carbohydrate ABC transporter permease n=1 Tax=Devosia sp. TaxID=1871048 RepID=UPI002619856E|nr:sugar ABC transporter permease [Devosia sp.]MDB5586607.1 maltose transporter permease protein [Devosia sp.]
MSATAMTSDGRLAASERARKEKQKARRDTRMSYLLLAPYLLLLAMFGLFPIAYAFGLSFFDTIEMVFWGVTNYQFVFNDFRVPASVLNVLGFVGIWVAMTVIGVATLSLMLDSVGRRTANALRTVYFLPGAVTSSAIVVLWLFVLDPSVSPFQPVLHGLGWGTRAQVISGVGLAGIFAIMAYFSSSGGWIVVFGGALSSLPVEVMEAARIDGANRFQLALRIKLPLIWRSLVLMAILSLAGGLQLFVEPQLMGLAGPQFAQNDWSLNQMAFQYAFRMGDFGASAALSTMLVGASIAIALVIVFATKFYKID